jgi:O-acetyl-ADP-ribose deacetylase
MQNECKEKITIGAVDLELVLGDITRQTTDAIVNAASSSLLGGGGVDGAIHRAGGPAILEECRRIRAARGPLPSGEAVITTGGTLLARHVIHTVGPIWAGGAKGEAPVLRRCYQSCLALAREHTLRSLSFPSISTGAYHYPVGDAAAVAVGTVGDELANDSGALTLVRFVLFDEVTFDAYARMLVDTPTVTIPALR